jgi:hypothetical protein
MEVDYTRTLTKIDKMFRFKEISENEWRVLYAIFEKFNDFQFQSKSSKFANPEIMSRSLIFRPATINSIFNKLAQLELIEFDKGTRGGDAKTVTPLFFVYRSSDRSSKATSKPSSDESSNKSGYEPSVKSSDKLPDKSSVINPSSSATSKASSSPYQPVKSTETLTSKAIAKLSKDNNTLVGQADNDIMNMFSDEPKPESKPKPKKPKSTLTKQEQADFEELWEQYPRKSGKDKAAVNYAKAVRAGVSKQQIATAIAAYKQEIKVLGTDPQYVKMGSTWFHQKGWESEYITAVPAKPASSKPYGRQKIIEPPIATNVVQQGNDPIDEDRLPEFMKGYFSEVKTHE